MASLTLWNAKMLCLLLKVECGSVALVTTDLLSPNIYDLYLMGTPRYLSVYLISMICSVAVLAATNSDPYVVVSTVACFLEYQSVGVRLQKWRHAVNAPVAMQWRRLASRVVVVVTDFPSGLVLKPKSDKVRQTDCRAEI